MKNTLCIALAVGCTLGTPAMGQDNTPGPAATEAAKPPAGLSAMSDVVVITRENAGELEAVMQRFEELDRGLIVLDDTVPPGPLPRRLSGAVRVLDLRYHGGMNILRGHHPRSQGIWAQYSGLQTGLARNVVLSDVVTSKTPIENWEGKAVPPQKTDFSRAQDFAHYHNHYQNLLVETWNFTPNVNGVSFWADSAALVTGAQSWGGFISTRSWPFRWLDYLPEDVKDFKDEDFDAGLVGLEIDVLNFGKPHGEVSPVVGKPLQKVGLQLVGFGKQSTAAIEIRSEDTDAFELTADQRRGTWYYGIIANNCFSSQSTLIKTAFHEARLGIDMSITDFREGAIKIRSAREGSGMMLNEGSSGEWFGGPRVRDGKDQLNWMSVRIGDGGFRIVSRDAAKELLTIDNQGNVTITGNVTVNGKPLAAAEAPQTQPPVAAAGLGGSWSDPRLYGPAAIGGAALLWMGFTIASLRRRLVEVEKLAK